MWQKAKEEVEISHFNRFKDRIEQELLKRAAEKKEFGKEAKTIEINYRGKSDRQIDSFFKLIWLKFFNENTDGFWETTKK
jgi:hypothetical protein